ncbi:hypothetical protein, partial [Acinetobacter baumannii]|uniref:hypothetical protein n=1 Tax=Acinetobacter baumannii TaxID=470 RepID=UPI003D6B1482
CAGPLASRRPVFNLRSGTAAFAGRAGRGVATGRSHPGTGSLQRGHLFQTTGHAVHALQGGGRRQLLSQTGPILSG